MRRNGERDTLLALPTVVLFLFEYLSDPSLRFHRVVGAGTAFSTSLRKNFFKLQTGQPVDFAYPEPTYEWRMGNDDGRCGG